MRIHNVKRNPHPPNHYSAQNHQSNSTNHYSHPSFLSLYILFLCLLYVPSFSLNQFLQIKMRKPCCDKQGNNKGAWSKQEDQKLIDYITTHGEGCWRSLPKAAGLHRCGKSCRLRWINYLRPDIKRGNFAQDEEDLIIKLHALLGNRWSLIAGRLPGRTDNEVKNYWNSHIRKKLINMGIDPNNHRLNQILPNPIIKDNDYDNKEPKNCNNNNTNNNNNNNEDRVSDAASCLEDETNCSGSSHHQHLNLDLSIAVPSPTSAPQFITNFDKSQENCDTAAAVDLQTDHISPALILFV